MVHNTIMNGTNGKEASTSIVNSFKSVSRETEHYSTEMKPSKSVSFAVDLCIDEQSTKNEHVYLHESVENTKKEHVNLYASDENMEEDSDAIHMSNMPDLCVDVPVVVDGAVSCDVSCDVPVVVDGDVSCDEGINETKHTTKVDKLYVHEALTDTENIKEVKPAVRQNVQRFDYTPRNASDSENIEEVKPAVRQNVQRFDYTPRNDVREDRNLSRRSIFDDVDQNDSVLESHDSSIEAVSFRKITTSNVEVKREVTVMEKTDIVQMRRFTDTSAQIARRKVKRSSEISELKKGKSGFSFPRVMSSILRQKSHNISFKEDVETKVDRRHSDITAPTEAVYRPLHFTEVNESIEQVPSSHNTAHFRPLTIPDGTHVHKTVKLKDFSVLSSNGDAKTKLETSRHSTHL